jgi:hypothetical protein
MIRIEFKGYVNGVRTFDWGTVYNVSHNQVRKNHQGEWETVGRDYLSVVGPAGFAENDQVEIVGRLKTKLYDKRDGSGKGISLEVRADEMKKVQPGVRNQPVESQLLDRASGIPRDNDPASVADMQQLWPNVRQVPDDSVPF